MNDNTFLTDAEGIPLGIPSVADLDMLDTLLGTVRIAEKEMALRPFDRSSEPIDGKDLLVLELEGRLRLSEATKRREARRLASKERRRLALRLRKRTSARGARHWKSKEKTARIRREDRWDKDPFSCILNMDTRKCKRIDREEFYREVYPLWSRYNSTNLRVKFPRGTGTKKAPWTLYNMKVYNGTELVWDGNSYEMYVLSGTSREANSTSQASSSIPAI